MIAAFLTVIFVLVCLAVVGVVLLQQGKGAGFAGAFGIGAGSQTIFGSRAGTFFTKLTAGLVAALMVLALLIAFANSRTSRVGAPKPEAVPENVSEAGEEPETAGGLVLPDVIPGAVETPADVPAVSVDTAVPEEAAGTEAPTEQTADTESAEQSPAPSETPPQSQ